MAKFPDPDQGILLTHFIVSADVDRSEIRAYLRDPDGHLIEVGQLTASL